MRDSGYGGGGGDGGGGVGGGAGGGGDGGGGGVRWVSLQCTLHQLVELTDTLRRANTALSKLATAAS